MFRTEPGISDQSSWFFRIEMVPGCRIFNAKALMSKYIVDVIAQSLDCVQVFVTPWTAAFQASLSLIFQSLPKFTSIKSAMPSNHLILCCPLLLLPSVFACIKVMFKELILHIRWPEYWSFIFSTSPSSEHSGLIFLSHWLVWFPCSPRDSRESFPVPQFESINSLVPWLLYGPTHIHTWPLEEP